MCSFDAKVKGGALLISLYIIIVATLLSSLLLFLHLREKEIILKSQIRLENIELINNGLLIYLQNAEKFSENKKKEVRLFPGQRSTLNITPQKWGSFNLVNISSEHPLDTSNKVALIGEKRLIDLPSLSITDKKDRELGIAGRTYIEGPIAIPNKKISVRYISQKDYAFKHKIQGNKTILTKSQFPNTDLAPPSSYIKNKETIEWRDVDNMERSFNKPTLHIELEGGTTVINKSLKGNIFISSKNPIVLSSAAKLSGVIIEAPIIIVKKRFQGDVQLFGSDSIHIERAATLSFPSTVYARNDGKINIEDGVTIEGFVNSGHTSSTEKVHVTIGKSVIHGLLACGSKLISQADVYGKIITESIQSKKGLDPNTLVDNKIKPSEKSPKVLYPTIFSSSQNLGLISWVE